MIKLSQILLAVNSKLRANFKDIRIDSRDLDEKFHRPSFRTELDGLKTSALGTTLKERKFTIRIYYFPTEKEEGRIERLKITEGLEDCLLQSLYITENFIIPVEELHFEESDGVLIASFDSVTVERIYNDLDIPMMEFLEWKVNNHTND